MTENPLSSDEIASLRSLEERAGRFNRLFFYGLALILMGSCASSVAIVATHWNEISAIFNP